MNQRCTRLHAPRALSPVALLLVALAGCTKSDPPRFRLDIQADMMNLTLKPDEQATGRPAIASGDALVTFALGEGLGPRDAAQLGATVTDRRLTGEKPLVPYGDVADAIVVAARDEVGPGLWIVERGSA